MWLATLFKAQMILVTTAVFILRKCFRCYVSMSMCRGGNMGKLEIELSGRKFVAEISDSILDHIFNIILKEVPQATWKISSVSEAKFVTHEAETPVEKQEKVLHKREMPSEDEVYQFIKTQPNYEHSFKSVAEHFLGYVPMRLKGGRKEYDMLWNRIKAARQRIASEENGRWQTETVEGRKVYRFVPDSE